MKKYKHLTLIKSGKEIEQEQEPDLQGFEAVIAFYHLEQEHEKLKRNYESLMNYKDKLEEYCNYLKEVTNYKEIINPGNTTRSKATNLKHKS